MNKITTQEYEAAKSVVEEYESQNKKYTYWTCDKNLFWDDEQCFTKGKPYRQLIHSEEITVIDDDGDEHELEQWAKHFTKTRR